MADFFDKLLNEAAARLRQRAARRKSPVNLLLPLLGLPLWLALWYGHIALSYHLFAAEPCAQDAVLKCLPQTGTGVMLVTLTPLMTMMPVAMIIVNAALFMVTPVRRVLDREAENFPETTYARSQKSLLILAAIVVPIGAVLVFQGFRLMQG